MIQTGGNAMSKNPKPRKKPNRGVNKGVMGRPKIPFTDDTWKTIKKLCQIMCTAQEIASHIECSIDTLEDRIKAKYNCTFPELFKNWNGDGKISLRRKQFEIAMKGNVGMLIWLGKQYLDQTEKREDFINIKDDAIPDDLKSDFEKMVTNEILRKQKARALSTDS
jgi:hypothetical protein